MAYYTSSHLHSIHYTQLLEQLNQAHANWNAQQQTANLQNQIVNQAAQAYTVGRIMADIKAQRHQLEVLTDRVGYRIADLKEAEEVKKEVVHSVNFIRHEIRWAIEQLIHSPIAVIDWATGLM